MILLDAAETVLGGFAPALSARTQTHLISIGVEVQLAATVVGVDQSGLHVRNRDGTHRRIHSVCKIWAAGVAGNPLGAQLAEQTGAGVDRAGRVVVLEDLSLPSRPEVHVVGDMMARPHAPGIAQAAIQAARHAADDIHGQLKGGRPKGPWTYRDKGNMAASSRFRAVAEVGRIRTLGFTA